MSYSISTLLTRNLQEVFGENDPARRRAAVDELYLEDGVFYDPSKGVYRGRDEIDRIAGEIRATHPEFRYQPIDEPEEVGDGGRVRWVAGLLAMRQLTPGLISSLPGMAGLPLFISFSTRCAELVSGVLLSSDGSFVFLAPEEFLALTGTINIPGELASRKRNILHMKLSDPFSRLL